MMYGQKRHPKDVKTQPQDEFITHTSNNLSDAAEETPVRPGAAVPDNDGLEAREIDEEGLEIKQPGTKEAGKRDDAG